MSAEQGGAAFNTFKCRARQFAQFKSFLVLQVKGLVVWGGGQLFYVSSGKQKAQGNESR
jgi:hypothetical protein